MKRKKLVLVSQTQHAKFILHCDLSLSLSLSLSPSLPLSLSLSLSPHSACGLEYCVECEENEEPGGHDECIECMTDTILFEGECFACPLATIARTAIVQEAEEQAEERANQLRQIECKLITTRACTRKGAK